jgi:hypothetical protein
MSSRRRYPGEPRCLRVVPRTRGDWIVMTEQQVAISEHASVTEAGHAVVARLREGDELVVYDCYHAPSSSSSSPPLGRRPTQSAQ